MKIDGKEYKTFNINEIVKVKLTLKKVNLFIQNIRLKFRKDLIEIK